MGDRDENLDVAIQRAQAGDPRGFDALFEACGRSVVGYLRARSVGDPDDIANEVFLRAFRTIHTFQGDASRFRSWLFTIAHHAAVDEARRRRRRLKETSLEHAPDPAGGDVEADVLTRLARGRVDTLLSGLSPDQRDVIMLRIVGDLSVEQTAAVVGKSFEAVKALQRRGLASLRRALAVEQAVTQ